MARMTAEHHDPNLVISRRSRRFRSDSDWALRLITAGLVLALGTSACADEPKIHRVEECTPVSDLEVAAPRTEGEKIIEQRLTTGSDGCFSVIETELSMEDFADDLKEGVATLPTGFNSPIPLIPVEFTSPVRPETLSEAVVKLIVGADTEALSIVAPGASIPEPNFRDARSIEEWIGAMLRSVQTADKKTEESLAAEITKAADRGNNIVLVPGLLPCAEIDGSALDECVPGTRGSEPVLQAVREAEANGVLVVAPAADCGDAEWDAVCDAASGGDPLWFGAEDSVFTVAADDGGSEAEYVRPAESVDGLAFAGPVPGCENGPCVGSVVAATVTALVAAGYASSKSSPSPEEIRGVLASPGSGAIDAEAVAAAAEDGEIDLMVDESEDLLDFEGVEVAAEGSGVDIVDDTIEAPGEISPSADEELPSGGDETLPAVTREASRSRSTPATSATPTSVVSKVDATVPTTAASKTTAPATVVPTTVDPTTMVPATTVQSVPKTTELAPSTTTTQLVDPPIFIHNEGRHESDSPFGPASVEYPSVSGMLDAALQTRVNRQIETVATRMTDWSTWISDSELALPVKGQGSIEIDHTSVTIARRMLSVSFVGVVRPPTFGDVFPPAKSEFEPESVSPMIPSAPIPVLEVLVLDLKELVPVDLDAWFAAGLPWEQLALSTAAEEYGTQVAADARQRHVENAKRVDLTRGLGPATTEALPTTTDILPGPWPTAEYVKLMTAWRGYLQDGSHSSIQPSRSGLRVLLVVPSGVHEQIAAAATSDRVDSKVPALDDDLIGDGGFVLKAIDLPWSALAPYVDELPWVSRAVDSSETSTEVSGSAVDGFEPTADAFGDIRFGTPFVTAIESVLDEGAAVERDSGPIPVSGCTTTTERTVRADGVEMIFWSDRVSTAQFPGERSGRVSAEVSDLKFRGFRKIEKAGFLATLATGVDIGSPSTEISPPPRPPSVPGTDTQVLSGGLRVTLQWEGTVGGEPLVGSVTEIAAGERCSPEPAP